MAVKSLAQSSILQPSNVNSMLGSYESNYFHHLETVRLGNNASSITFTNLSQYADYQHLQVRFVGTQVNVGGLDTMLMRVNGDTGSNYSFHYLRNINSTVASGAQASYNYPYIGLMAGKDQPESGALIIDFVDAFETTKYKTIRSLGGTAISGDKGVGLYTALWMNTSAVSSITLAGFTGNLAAGSRFSLYGIKAR
jgi:hypothetical protein